MWRLGRTYARTVSNGRATKALSFAFTEDSVDRTRLQWYSDPFEISPTGSPVGCAHGTHLFLIGIHGARAGHPARVNQSVSQVLGSWLIHSQLGVC